MSECMTTRRVLGACASAGRDTARSATDAAIRTIQFLIDRPPLAAAHPRRDRPKAPCKDDAWGTFAPSGRSPPAGAFPWISASTAAPSPSTNHERQDTADRSLPLRRAAVCWRQPPPFPTMRAMTAGLRPAEARLSALRNEIVRSPPSSRRPLMSVVGKAAGGTAIVLAAAAAWLCFWPVPAEPVAWPAPTPPGYTGAFAPNTRLAGLRMIDLGGEVGPEHVAIGPDGKLYAAMEGGRLLRMAAGRRPAGSLRDHGRARPRLRLRCRRTPDRSRRLQGAAGHHAGPARQRAGRSRQPDDPIGYADAIVVAPDGTIYFTDASTRFSPAAMGRHAGGKRARYHGAIRHRPSARPRPGDGKDAHRGPRLLLRQRHRARGRRPHAVRDRDGPLPHLEDRRPRERPRCAGGDARLGGRRPGCCSTTCRATRTT